MNNFHFQCLRWAGDHAIAAALTFVSVNRNRSIRKMNSVIVATGNADAAANTGFLPPDRTEPAGLANVFQANILVKLNGAAIGAATTDIGSVAGVGVV